MSTTPGTWLKLAERLGGRYIRVGDEGSVTLKVHGGTIALEAIVYEDIEEGNKNYSTRLSGTYAHMDDFVFSVRSNTLLQKLATLIGRQDLEIGDPEFDSAFVVRANDAQKARELFADEVIRRLLLSAHHNWGVMIETHDSLNDNPNSLTTVLGCRRALVWKRGGLEDNEQLLLALFEIYKHMLSRLCDLGMATPDG